MRIALLSAEYPPDPGGIGDYTRQLGLALARRGLAPRVWTIAGGRWVSHDLCVGTTRAVPARQAAGWGWRSWGGVQTFLEAERPDLLHVQYQTGAYGMHPAINFLPRRLRALPTHPPLIVTAHDLLEPYLFPKAGPARGWVTRRLLRDADAAVVTNEQDFEQARRRFGLGRHTPLRLIPIGSNIAVAPPPGYDRAAWRAQLGVRPGETLVAFFGLLSRSKGVDMLVDALARLPEHVKLLIVGGEAAAPQDRAYAAEILFVLAQSAVGARARITGHADEAQVSAYLLAADLAALPFADGATFRRGSLLAALAHGLPVVTTDGGRRSKVEGRTTNDQRPTTTDEGRKTKDYQLPTTNYQLPTTNYQLPTTDGEPLAVANSAPQLIDGQNVLLVGPGDAAALAGAIQRLSGDAELRLRLSQGARELAAQFGWDAIAEQHEMLYRALRG